MSEYQGRLRFHHVDAWRLSDADEFAAVGAADILSDQGGVVAIEWSEKVTELLPPGTVGIELEVRDDDSRLALLSGPIPDDWLAP